MSTFNTTTLAFRVKPVMPPATLSNLLLKIPEELTLQILGYVVSLPGAIAKAEFEDGVCDWPTCQCQDGTWKHAPIKTFTSENLAHLLLKTQAPIPRLAELAFYSSNVFHLCGPQYDPKPVRNVIRLPPSGIRHWIRHLEVTIEVAFPRVDDWLQISKDPSFFGIAPRRDWDFLRRLQQGSHGLTGLRTLKLMFEALLIGDEELQILERELAKVEPFHFQTKKLMVEACSTHWNGENDCWTGRIIPNDKLRKLLEKFMFSSGKKDVSCAFGECRATKA